MYENLKVYKPEKNCREVFVPGAALLGLHAKSLFDIEQEAEKGFSPETVNIIKNELNLSYKEILKNIGTSNTTFHRIKNTKSKRLSRDVSIRVYQYARLLERATEVLGGREEAREWLHEPLLAIGNRTPIDVARTGLGVEQVLQVLGQLEYGVYS